MIGIFSSGIGGLTVVKEIKKALPFYDLVYFGDTARAPYGNKSEKLIKQYALQDADFLIKYGTKIIVVACNTVAAVALNELLTKISIPVLEVITPALQSALATTVSGRIGVIGARATINSGAFYKQQKILSTSDNIDSPSNLNEPAFIRKKIKIKNCNHLK